MKYKPILENEPIRIYTGALWTKFALIKDYMLKYKNIWFYIFKLKSIFL